MQKKALWCIIAAVVFGMVSVGTVEAEYKTSFGPTGVLRYDEAKSYGGYTILEMQTVRNRWVYLINMEGKIVHTWKNDRTGAACARLTPQGTLTRQEGSLGSSQGGLFEYDWDGKLIQTYRSPDPRDNPHHLHWRKPNGNTLTINRRNYTQAEGIAAGRDASLLTAAGFSPDCLLEYNPSAQVIWEWDPVKLGIVAPVRAYDKLYASLPTPSTDYMHVNSVSWDPTRNWVLFSSVNWSEVWAVDYASKQIVWRWGNPANWGGGDYPTYPYANAFNMGATPNGNMTSGYTMTAEDQMLWGVHDVTWNPLNNNIVCMNNGESPLNPGSIGMEIDPATDKVIWQYPTKSPTPNFYSRRQSSCQALPNGNYMINLTTGGHITEVTNSGEIVWEYKVPIGSDGPKCYVSGYGDNWGMQNAFRYGADYAGLVGKDLSKAVPFKEGCEEVWKKTEPTVVKPTVSINGGTFATGQPLLIEVTLSGPGPYNVYAGMTLGTTRYYAFDTNMCYPDANHVYPLRKEFTPSGSTIKVFQFTVPPLAANLTAGVFVDVMNPGYDTALASATNTVNLNYY